jgi:hypothetical protein
VCVCVCVCVRERERPMSPATSNCYSITCRRGTVYSPLDAMMDVEAEFQASGRAQGPTMTLLGSQVVVVFVPAPAPPPPQTPADVASAQREAVDQEATSLDACQVARIRNQVRLM